MKKCKKTGDSNEDRSFHDSSNEAVTTKTWYENKFIQHICLLVLEQFCETSHMERIVVSSSFLLLDQENLVMP